MRSGTCAAGKGRGMAAKMGATISFCHRYYWKEPMQQGGGKKTRSQRVEERDSRTNIILWFIVQKREDSMRRLRKVGRWMWLGGVRG